MIAVVGAIYCLRSDTFDKNSQKEIKNSNEKLKRILLTSIKNTIGKYTIINSESYTIYCENIEINLYSTETDLAAKHEKLSSYFSHGRDDLIAQDITGFIVANIPVFAINFIFLLFSIYLVFWILIFLLCSSFCKCCASSINEKDDSDNSDNFKSEKNLEKGCCKSNRCRKCMYITNFVIIAGIAILLVLWFEKYLTTINTIDIVYCGTTTIFNSVLNGISSAEFEFAGLNGFIYFLNTALTEVDSTLSSPEPQNIINMDLITTANAFTPSLLAFYNNFKDYTVKDPVNGATDLKSETVQQLTTKINEIIGTEYDLLSLLGTQINTGAVTLNNFHTSQVYTDFKDGIGEVMAQLNSMKYNLTAYDNLIHFTIDLPGKKPLMTTGLYMGGFVLLVIIV